jgi:hypothetical protein
MSEGAPPPRPNARGVEAVGLLVLLAVAGLLLAVSWRRWPDPLIDFGRQLYLPWLISNGGVLYRDAEDFYGPLSQYFNAGLFRLFGPGLMVLAWANLAILAAIAALMHLQFRRAWGAAAAFAASLVFLSLFAFSQFTGISNYNFVTPYSHEATHGFLLLALLPWVLGAWLERPRQGLAFLAGLLAGASLVLKAEIALAALATCLVAALLHARGTRAGPRDWRALAAWLGGAMLPTMAFAVFFSRFVPWPTALDYASRAWLNVVATSRFVSDPSQLAFLGMDAPGRHLLEHALATALALALLGAIALLARIVSRSRDSTARPWQVLVVALACALLSWQAIDWEQAGKCLAGLMLCYLAWRTFAPGDEGEPSPRARHARILLAVAAMAMLARMLLNGRIHHFGFFQAALAAMVVSAVVVGELPARLALDARGRVALRAGFGGVLLAGICVLVANSIGQLAMKTFPVAEGRDRFYATDPRIEQTGELVRIASEGLRQAAGGAPGTLLVLPDGEMLNYLARMPSPIPPALYYSSATAGGREARIVRELARSPPDWVVLISHDLGEFGIRRYGERRGQGQDILRWVRENYEVAGSFGGDPLDPAQRGLVLLARKP